jgi:hypothetical protein
VNLHHQPCICLSASSSTTHWLAGHSSSAGSVTSSSHALTVDGLSSKRPLADKRPDIISLDHACEFGLTLQPSDQHPFLPYARIWWLRPWTLLEERPTSASAERRQEGGQDAFLFRSRPSLRFFTSSTSAIVAPICRWSAILASVSVVDIGHWRGLSVLNVSHRCGCHRPRRWPLLQLQSSPISFSTLAVVVVVAVINVGHHCGRCRRQHQLVHLQSHCCY